MKKTPVYASVQRGTWNQSSGAVQHQVRSEGVRWGPKFAARSATFAPEAYSFDVLMLLILTGRSFAAICMLHFFLPSFSLADFKNRSKIFSAVDRDVTTFRFCFVFCLFVFCSEVNVPLAVVQCICAQFLPVCPVAIEWACLCKVFLIADY